ncbi:DNA polymerase II [Gallaecimonas kandeliae]|uniref:DNA polymerase II n=1 Tax=Gallaecimonas kandeliae TaxID=3029055 RepID=UPI0026474CB5|nr:DNA polymerase II [Gallaecimonas kandeliae]WKE66397.1 DNA polymerase II [Gallaecimonas kandeliae]
MPQGFLLSRHSRDQQGATEIVLWLSTDQGPARLVIEGERPVLMVAAAKLEKAKALLGNLLVESRDLGFKDFGRQGVAMLYFPTLEAHKQGQAILTSNGLEVLEADIKLQDRFLMERFARGGIAFEGQPIQKPGYTEWRQVRLKGCDYHPKLKVLSLDLECSAKGELYSAGLYGHGVASVIMVGQPQEAELDILWVEDEKALLRRLEVEIARLDPDILIGWSLVAFDIRLLAKRAERHGLTLRLGRGGEPLWLRDGTGDGQAFASLPGRVAIDGIDGLKIATYNFESFSLESVSQALLGRGKKTEDVDNRLAQIEHDFRHDKPKLAAYNLEDCVLVWDIFAHTKLLDFLVLRSQLTGLELDRAGGSVAAFTNLYLPRLHRAGFVAPNLPAGGGLASPGGYVMDSRPGLYRNVLVLDFKSLYPSIIRTFKIDPLGLITGLEEEDAIPGFREAKFSRAQHFLPAIITELWQARDQAKRQQDGPRSQAIKILMNSFYGVLGSGGCRFYDTRLASSITLRGHAIMQQTAQWVRDAGHQVIYGDTDSTFVLLDENLGSDEADAIGRALAADINERWRQKLREEFDLDCFLELEYETHYQRFLMPTIRGSEAGSKKRYAGMKAGGELVFKGLETVRTDWTPLAKHFQTELYRLVFEDQDPSDFVRRTVEETLAGQRDEELVYRKRLRRRLDQYVKNVPPHVRAARLADEHNKKAGKTLKYQGKGSISYLMTLSGPEPLEYRQSPIDYQHYIDRQLKPVAEAILPFVDLEFERLVGGQLGLF